MTVKPNAIYTLKAAKTLGVMCGYLILDSDNSPVYIGMTSNTGKRFEAYTGANSHNEILNDWLILNQNPNVLIIEEEYKQLSKLEINLIKKHANTLFNIIHVEYEPTHYNQKQSKPWIARTGVMCPSSLVLRQNTLMGWKDYPITIETKKAIAAMGDLTRTLFEIETAHSLINFGRHRSRIIKWLDSVSDKAIRYVDSKGGVPNGTG